jgi:hypothetical protein
VTTEYDCCATEEPICPYCGSAQGDFWEVSGNKDNSGEYDCGSCTRVFTWSCMVSVTYSTTPIIGPHALSEFQQENEALEKP